MAKAKQGKLPGMEEPTIKEVEEAADLYYVKKNKRIKLSAEEKDSKVNLIEIMLKNNLTKYKTEDGLIVNLVNKSNVTCRTADEEEGDINEEE